MKVLYLDCFSGVSGDMLLGALLDAGVDRRAVDDAIASLGLDDVDISVANTKRGALAATKVDVEVPDNVPSRKVTEVIELIDSSSLSRDIAHHAIATFELLGRAEARVHGVDYADAHLHEAGALDAIVDIVGVCAAIANLAPDRIVTSTITTGRGSVDSEHGTIPVPAPAVIELLVSRKAPLLERGTDELVTPTGAALIAHLTDEFGDMPALQLEAVGYGAGTRELATPNVLRAMVGKALDPTPADKPTSLMEANLDDMTPELVPHVIDELMTAGAQDAWATPIVMKKGRPAVTLSVLAANDDLDRLMDVLYRETTTLGLRIVPVMKNELERGWLEVEVSGKPVRVKFGKRGGEIITLSPEYEDARAVARATGRPLKQVMADALRAATERASSYK